jgi:hypothetical protein
MYSNSVQRNPIFQSKRAPRLGNENFAVGCLTESTVYDKTPKAIHRTKYVQQNYEIRNNTSRTVLEYTKALNYEKNANLNLFSDINQNNRSVGLSAPVLHRRAFYNPPLMNNNTTQETDKPRLIKEHIGATNTTNFPTTRIGQEQLRQKALMNITELPSIMKSLIDSVKYLKQISNTKDNIEVPEIVESSDVAPTTMPSSSAGTVDDNRYTEDVPPEVDEFLDSNQDMDIEKFNNELKELERISSRIKRNGTASDRTVAKLIEWDVITSEMSSNSELILERIDEYSELIKAEIAEMSGA